MRQSLAVLIRLRVLGVLVATVVAASCGRPPKQDRGHDDASPLPKPTSGAPSTRTIRFSGGSVAVIVENHLDHVTVMDAGGRPISESWCDHADAPYDSVAAFFARFRTALITGDRPLVANQIAFPLRVNGSRSWRVANRNELLASYDRIFPAGVVDGIRVAAPEAVFCRHFDTAMLGDGIVWAESHGAHVRVNVVNQ